MVLHAENGKPPVPKSFQRLVVEVDVTGFHVGRQRLWVDGEPMVLGGDLHLARVFVPDGMVGPRWPNLSLNVEAPKAWPRS